MSTPNQVPPAIMSLGSNFDRARDFLKQTETFDGQLGVQIEYMPDAFVLTRLARERDIFIAVNTHFTNEAAIQADLLYNFVFEHDEPRKILPNAITIEPQYRSPLEESNQLRQVVEAVESAGVRVIGVPDSYSLPVGHTEEFVRLAANSCKYLGRLGVNIVEVIFPILRDLVEGEGIGMNDNEHLIVSKTSRRKPVAGYKNDPTDDVPAVEELEIVKEGVVSAFRLGAKTVTLGRTFMGISDHSRRQSAIAEIIDLVPSN